MTRSQAVETVREIRRLSKRILLSPGSLRARRRGDLLMLGFPLSIWLRLTAPFRSLGALARWGPAAKRLSGRALWRQLADLLSISVRLRHAPRMYYVWELYRDGRWKDAGLYVDSTQNAEILFALLPRRKSRLSKAGFHELCPKHGLRSVPVLATCSASWPEPNLAEPDSPEWNGDLYEKPSNSHRGQGIRRWKRQDDGAWATGEIRAANRDELLAIVSAAARRDVHMIQPRRLNHPDIAWVPDAPISTIRLVTLRPLGGGDIELLPPWMRIPRMGAAVDNLHQGGLLASVDLATGQVGRVQAWHEVGLAEGLERHPDSDRLVHGVIVPFWEEAKELCRKAQNAFPKRASVGWDVGIDESGPFLLELNALWGCDVLQSPESPPFGLTPFAPIILEHLRARARHR